MNCNFYSDYKGVINRVNVCNVIIAFAFYLLGSTAFAFCVVLFTIGTEIELNFIKVTLAFLSTFPVFLFGLAYKKFRENKKVENAEFTYKMFRDWYSLSPKRFVFAENGFGFHYMVNGNPEYINEDDKISTFSWRESNLHRSHKYLVPKTFIDCIRYILFVERLHLAIEYKWKKQEQIMQRKYKNEELLTVLNVVQSDIDKVMRDSQNILNQEADKLERVRNEQLS